MPAFSTVVLHLPVPGMRPAWVDVATLARLLGAELRAVYCEDEALFEVADLPGAREFDPLRLHHERWRPLDRGQLLRDFELTAATLRRQFDRIARATGIGLQFTIVRAGSQAPETPSNTVFVIPAGEFHNVEAPDAGALLFMPRGTLRHHGDVVVLSSELDALPVLVAREIADNAKARAIVIDASGSAEHLQHELGRLHERLIVVGTATLTHWQDAARLAALRRVPVLLVPDEAESRPERA
jgi:hypothetical protein